MSGFNELIDKRGMQIYTKTMDKIRQMCLDKKYSDIKAAETYATILMVLLKYSSKQAQLIERYGYMQTHKSYSQYLDEDYPDLVFHINFLNGVLEMHFENHYPGER